MTEVRSFDMCGSLPGMAIKKASAGGPAKNLELWGKAIATL